VNSKALIAVVCITVLIAASAIFLFLLPKAELFQSIVIFRDDDIQPWFAFDRLVEVNNIFTEEAVPVTLSVIPFIGNHTLAQDPTLSDYLKNLTRTHPNLFEIAMQGYSHQLLSDFYGGSEFGSLEYPNQYGRIYLGKKSLKETLNVDPVTFIPPFDTYDNNTALALEELGFKAVSGGAWFTEAYYNRTNPFIMQEILHVPASQAFIKNWENHTFHTLDFLKTRFDDFYEKRLIYIQTIHFFTFTSQEKLDQLEAFIDFIKNHEKVKFMTLRSFAEAYLDGKIEKTAEGWKVSPLTFEIDFELDRKASLRSEAILVE
jgi:peptidoglycan/xylan/chitin deacetylase (PgdA/CDA1 family)